MKTNLNLELWCSEFWCECRLMHPLTSSLLCSVTRERGVWLGLSDMDSPGKLHWVNGSEVEENSPSRPDISPGNACVSLDQDSQISSHLCSSKRVYMCQYTLPGTRRAHTWSVCAITDTNNLFQFAYSVVFNRTEGLKSEAQPPKKG